ncbi:hypothetical protein L9F63_002005 [Diploptera punctata]|uniref:Uncharacterized protein n=1 Tax=Diploptera punctata TaxID=6984 RepID=A0AAD8A2R3_DIPPU|nr:hypothetical protein L9F63_002005 [Diploptera punctata]
MSAPIVNKFDVPDSPPPTYQESTHGAQKDSPYSKRENSTNDAFPQGVPVLLTMPLPLRDVGRGNVMYEVNQSTQSDGMDENLPFGSSFGDKAIRAVFVRKVYSIIMLQLLTTLIFIAWFMFHEPTRIFVKKNVYILIAAYLTFFITYCILVCCSSVRRSWPSNLIVLSIFTLSLSYFAATISAYHDTYIVLMTVGLVTVVCLGVSIFSIQTKWDITGSGFYLYVFLLVVFLFGILATTVALTTGSRIMSVIYAGLLTMVFALYLVYDTQQIIGGRKMQLSPEEHIFGALQLYFDIINLYVILLSFNNSCK